MNKLSDTWVLWFHNINDTNWDENSYTMICDIDTIENFWNVYNMFDTMTAGMFFLMRKGIFPRWEDIGNLDGGYWGFRISKKDSDKLWECLSMALIGNTLTKNIKDMDDINGISISPKINNCILKIWNKNSYNKSNVILNNIIDGLNPSQTLYKAHNDQNDLKK